MKGLREAIRIEALAGSIGKDARTIFGFVREAATIHRIKGALMIVAFGLFSILALSQSASFTGRVTDATGVIPKAQIIIQNEKTRVDLKSATTDIGDYTITYLNPGVYTVTAGTGKAATPTGNLQHLQPSAVLGWNVHRHQPVRRADWSHNRRRTKQQAALHATCRESGVVSPPQGSGSDSVSGAREPCRPVIVEFPATATRYATIERWPAVECAT